MKFTYMTSEATMFRQDSKGEKTSYFNRVNN